MTSSRCSAAWTPAGVLVLLLSSLAAAQMQSPLKGTGIPRLETTHVYVSVYLDRLLDVYEDTYRWEAVHYFYLSWTDNSVWGTMLAASQQMLTNSSFQCNTYCSNVAERVACCDNIYLPSFFFKNAYGFPQDREIMYNIYADGHGGVVWESRVHGVYYQPMDFSHYPFDSFSLAVELRFYDPTAYLRTDWLLGKNHTGIKVVPSSGGKKIYTIGRGDDASSWAVTDTSLEIYNVDMGVWFTDHSDMYSDPDDPMPLAPVNASVAEDNVNLAGNNRTNIFSGFKDQLLGVIIHIERFWRPSLINAVLPVILVFFLGMMTFVTSERALETRLQIVLTLFLALTAVQFVVIGRVPTSSYVVPTQQLVLSTYIFLFLLAIESIGVFHIVCRYEKRREAQRRREAWRRYCKLRDRGKLAGGQNPSLATAISENIPEMEPAGEDGKSSDELATSAASAEAGQRKLGFSCSSCFGNGGESPVDRKQRNMDIRVKPTQKAAFSIFFHAPKEQPEQPLQTTTTFRQLTADEAFGEHVGHLVDTVSAAVLGISYSITAILIFTLQNGYIELFDTA